MNNSPFRSRCSWYLNHTSGNSSNSGNKRLNSGNIYVHSGNSSSNEQRLSFPLQENIYIYIYIHIYIIYIYIYIYA